MSTELRAAIRITGNSSEGRRAAHEVEQALRKASRDGARALADESTRANKTLVGAGRQGAASYKTLRQTMRSAATDGAKPLRDTVIQTSTTFKQFNKLSRDGLKQFRVDLLRANKEGLRPVSDEVDKASGRLRRFGQIGSQALKGMKAAASGIRAEFSRLRQFGSTAMGKLAGLGLTVGVTQALKTSAGMDRQIIRTGQTANLSRSEREDWRRTLYVTGRKYGVEVQDVQTGFDTLIASGLNFTAAKNTSDAIAQATTITGADSSVLAQAVVSGAKSFDIDLEKPGAALELLEKMTVAGRLGNAELENLSAIFPVIGSEAKRAGMSMEQALAFVETLSLIEMDPGRLGTMARSSLRMFTVERNRKTIEKNTGISFFNADKSSRDPLAVLTDLQRKYQGLSNDQERAGFMGMVFKGMDQDTVNGMSILLAGDRLNQLSENTVTIRGASSVFQNDLKENIASATGSATRLKVALAESFDRMSQPINQALSGAITYALDDLNLSGEQMLAAGAAAGLGGYYGGRGIKAAGGALANKLFGGVETVRNIAVGKALEEAAGVTPVFVTNWPVGFGSGTDIIGGSRGRSGGRSGPGILAVAAPTVASALISSAGGDDAMMLANLQNSRMHSQEKIRYGSEFYKARMELAAATPGVNTNSQEFSAQAHTLARERSGLNSDGSPVIAPEDSEQARQDFWAWASQRAGQLLSSSQETGGGMLSGLQSRLAGLLDKPLVIEIKTDSDMILAEVERRADIQMRRGQ